MPSQREPDFRGTALRVSSLYAAYRQAARIAEKRQPEHSALVARIDDRLPGR
jgi:hypothetical protein